MGLLASREEPPPVDLLPPRFARRAPLLDQLAVSPLDGGGFGAVARARLLQAHYAEPGALDLAAAVHPDVAQRVRVAIDARLRPAAALAADAAAAAAAGKLLDASGVTLAYSDTLSEPATQLHARLGTEAAPRFGAGAVSSTRRLGAYVDVPLGYFRTRAAGAGGDGGGGEAGATEEPLPEIGVRFFAPSRTAAFGLHASPFPPYPTKAWVVGMINGSVMAGMQVATDYKRLTADTAAAVPAGAAAAAAEAVRAGSGSSRLPPPSGPVDINAAISLMEPPLYELSLAYDGSTGEMVAGYVHNMTVRRRVYNILEAANVKGIYNYVDLGFELRRPLFASSSTSLTFGAAWQLNRNVLLKGRVGTHNAAASVALKSWADPSLTVCATYSYDRRREASGVGVTVSLERGGEVEYQKGIEAYQDTPQNRVLLATEALSESRERVIDKHPLEPLPLPPPRPRLLALR